MSLVGKMVKLKNSPAVVKIAKVDNKGLYLDFGNDKPALISYIKAEEVLIIDEDTKQEIYESSLISHPREVKHNSSNAKKEGTENIAFKITYCDGGETNTNFGFRAPCSNYCRYMNKKANRSWCNNEMCLCAKLGNFEIDENEFIERIKNEALCYESKTLIDWKAYAGYDNTKNPPRPRRFNKLCHTGIALLTTVPHEENERVIFGLFKIYRYFEGNDQQEGFVEAHPEYRIEFTKDEARKMKFFDFYSNKNADNEKWGSGLFRYLSNEQILEVLRKALVVKNGKSDYYLVEKLAKEFCEEKNLTL